MNTVVLNGPMVRYNLKGHVFVRGVPKNANPNLRDELIGTGYFSDYARQGIKPAKPKTVSDDKTAHSGPPFAGRGAKKAAIAYGQEHFAATLDSAGSIRTLNDQLSHLIDGGSFEDLEGATAYEEEIEDDEDDDADESSEGEGDDDGGSGEVDL